MVARASARLLWLSVRGTGNKEIFQYQPSVKTGTVFPLKGLVLLVFLSMCIEAPLTFDLDLVSE